MEYDEFNVTFALVINQTTKDETQHQMKLNIDIDTSSNSLSVKLNGLKQEDYAAFASEVLDRAKEFINHLLEHIPTNVSKCDESVGCTIFRGVEYRPYTALIST